MHGSFHHRLHGAVLGGGNLIPICLLQRSQMQHQSAREFPCGQRTKPLVVGTGAAPLSELSGRYELMRLVDMHGILSQSRIRPARRYDNHDQVSDIVMIGS